MVQNFLNKQELVVPTADVATNVFAMDVIGNKNDTVAGTSMIALNKQAYASLGAPAGVSLSADIAVVDAFHDVPVQNAITNAQMRDVIGNKTDTIQGNSVYSKLIMGMGSMSMKQLTIDGNGAQSDNVFTIIGFVEVMDIYLVAQNVIDSTTLSGCKFIVYDGTNTVDITAASTDLSGITNGSLVIKNGDNTATLVYSKSDQIRGINKMSPLFTLSGKGGVTNYIKFNFTGDANTNVVAAIVVKYVPLSTDGAIVSV